MIYELTLANLLLVFCLCVLVAIGVQWAGRLIAKPKKH